MTIFAIDDVRMALSDEDQQIPRAWNLLTDLDWSFSDPDPVTTVAVVDPDHGADVDWLVRYVDAARRRGYAATSPGPSGWLTLWRTGHTIHVYHAGTATEPCAMLGDLDRSQGWPALRRLAWWRDVTSTWYHGMPGLPCLADLRTSITRPDGRHPAYRVDRPRDAAQRPVQAAAELVWRRTRAKDRTGLRWDMRSAYLAAASAADLGWSAPQPTGTDPEYGAPGWYRITVPRDVWRVGGVPVIDPGTVTARDRTVWVTWPIVAFLAELGHEPEIVDSFTSSAKGRLLRPWAERWRDILARLDPGHAGRRLVKMAYTQAIGLLGRPGVTVYRPDWHDTIRGQARVSMLRRVHRVAVNAGHEPAQVNVDAVYYTERDIDTRQQIQPFIGEGERIGNMRFEGLYAAGERVR